METPSQSLSEPSDYCRLLDEFRQQERPASVRGRFRMQSGNDTGRSGVTRTHDGRTGSIEKQRASTRACRRLDLWLTRDLATRPAGSSNFPNENYCAGRTALCARIIFF